MTVVYNWSQNTVRANERFSCAGDKHDCLTA